MTAWELSLLFHFYHSVEQLPHKCPKVVKLPSISERHAMSASWFFQWVFMCWS